ncbi:hypothetical protein AURDEDRAFT_143555 [Auricularia subglabra TFB-10046 SS5]|nr:hypothetical protein AURDEDRAFT_143555 [Auricularia subglabra TFB-10046 SS5]
MAVHGKRKQKIAMLLLTPDHDHLALALASRFKGLTGHLKDAVKVEDAFHRIMADALHMLCDLLYDWNEATVTCRLPAEVLGACFAFLPFEDRVTASHVSRAWRAAALAFPALWSTVAVPAGNFNADLMKMALGRSGVHPVDVLCDSHLAPRHHRHKNLISRALEDHMHHVRSVRWCGSVENACFARPAPMLEDLDCPGRGDIGHDFLGGRAGKLRALNLGEITLPPKCLALSTVTSLSACLVWDEIRVTNLSALFVLCPRLEHLALKRISHRICGYLPSGPAPPTLSSVTLEASEPACNLIPTFDSWNTERHIGTAHLTMSITAFHDVTPILRGAVDFTVEEEKSLRRWITLSSGNVVLQLHSIDAHIGADTPLIGQLIARSAKSLTSLVSLRLPLASIGAFVMAQSQLGSSTAVLPALRTLDVAWTYSEHSLVPEDFSCILHLRLMCPSLNTLNVDISFMDGSPTTTANFPLRCSVAAKVEGRLTGVCQNLDVRVEGADLTDIERQDESRWHGM